jgi:PAS domain S-box-containing protein
MTDNWLTIAQVEKKTGIPNRTIRRYMEQHCPYLMIEKQHRKYMFSVDSLPILIKIRELYANGLNAHQVNEILSQANAIIEVANDRDVSGDVYKDKEAPEISEVDYHRLIKSKTIFHGIFQNAHDIILLATVKTTRYVEVNNMACEKLGFSRNEFLEMSFMDIIDKERKVEQLLRTKQNCMERGYDIIVTNYISKSGIKIPVEIKICLIELSGEKFSLSIARDITERKQREATLLESNQTLKALNQASPLGSIVLDIKGNVKMWNPAFEQIFGWKEKEIMEYGIEPIIPENKLETFNALQNVTLLGKTLTGVEISCKKKDGSLIDVILSIAPLVDTKGDISGSIVIFANLAEFIPKKYTDSI